jgi:hypothetical protein
LHTVGPVSTSARTQVSDGFDAGTIGDPLPSAVKYGFERIIIPSDGSGVLGSGQIGYNWQVTPSFLLGIEADFSGSGMKADGKFGPSIPSPLPQAAGSSFVVTMRHEDADAQLTSGLV